MQLTNVEDIYPLSPMQEGMLFHSLYDPQSEIYFEQIAFTLRGHLNVPALQQAWEQVIARHAILRTLFLWEQLDHPLQIVRQQVGLPWTEHDWRHLPMNEARVRLQNFLRADRSQGFDLSQAPLLRLHLTRLSEQESHFTWSFHHILLDGWSVATVFGEVFTCYNALCQGHTLPLPASRYYSDYIAWLQQQDISQAEAFWREALRGFTVPTPLSVDIPVRRESETPGFRDYIFRLSATTTTALQTFAHQQQLTLNTLIQGAWALLLSRYSGQQDVVFGITVSGRPATLAGVEAMVGLFINTLPLRTWVDLQQQLLPWLHTLQISQADARQFDHTPLVQIQNWSEVPRGQALFESLLVFENYPVSASVEAGGGLEIEHGPDEEWTTYPLTITILPEDIITIHLGYMTSRFEDATIHRIAGHLQTLLEGMIADPQQRLGEIPFLTPAERQQLLVDWNCTTDFQPIPCLHSLFEVQVERNSDAIALVYEDHYLTYDALNACANQLAHHLQRLGITTETLVGLCLERSLEMLIGILGVLKAGAAYVPLDPSYPPERLAFLISDSQANVLLTESRLSGRLMIQKQLVLCLDTDWPVINMEPTINPAWKVNPDSLAYVIYTSGSTGQPKGVLVSHAQVTRLFAVTNAHYHFNQNDSWTLFHSYAFDFSVWEIWGAFLYGGRLVVVPFWQTRSPQDFSSLLQAQHISVLNQTPSAFRQLISTAEATQTYPDLRLVIFGGEALDPRILQPWFERHGDCNPQLINMYGITETTVHVTRYPLSWSDVHGAAQSPIGRPLDDLQVYILDTSMHLTPIGVSGEMYVGGDGLARGYLGQPSLTAERFVPHPFSTRPGARLYKTGDLARFLPDGTIEYLGRLDAQVKIRGFRIEPGEIEAILALHPSVQEAVVVAREDQPGDKRLVAYVVAHLQISFSSSELRHHLQSRLPDYMVPSAIVPLETLPLTLNGKLDRRALPAPDSDRSGLDKAYVAPRTPAEHLLADIWAQVLGLAQVGIHDNFFEVGGDSILSIQIVARAAVAGLALTPRHLFQQPTIAQLAQVIGDVVATQATQDLVLGSVFLTPIQHWFFALQLLQPQQWNQAILFEARQSLTPANVQEAVHILLTHHDMLRLRAHQQGIEWSLTIAEPDEQIPFSHFDLSTLPTEEQAAALETAANTLQASLDLTNGPIMRVAFFDFGVQQSARLLFVIHHLAVDIVSWSILLEDFQSAYQQLSQGQTPILPPKTTSYQSWAERLREYAQSPTVRSSLHFWLNQLWAEVQPLPLDIQGCPDDNTEESARTLAVVLSTEETQALLTEVPGVYHTHINEVLLTALVQAFARWTGHGTLLLHLEGHGREDVLDGVDISRTIGWFTSLTPLVLSLPANSEPGSTLKSVKEQLRQMPQHGLSFGLLRYLCRDTDISSQLAVLPRPEISFNYSGRVVSTSTEAELFAPASESMGTVHNPHGRRPHLLDINGGIAGGQLYIEWTYSDRLHRESTIERLAHFYLEALQELIAHCQSSEAGGYTPSDFPEATLTQNALDSLVATLARPNIHDEFKSKIPAIEAIYPLSPMQEGILFHHLYDPHSAVYFEQIAFTIHGTLDIAAFQQTWQQVIARHAILRTLFLWDHLDRPLQIVRPQVVLPWIILDWQHYSSEEQQERIRDFLHDDRTRGFDFTQAPLLRLHLIRLDEQVYHFTWSFHHILLDGWSTATLLGEVFACYEATSQKQELILPPVRPYRDYIDWLQQQDPVQAETFWRESLQGFSSLTPLGIDQNAHQAYETEPDYRNRVIQLSASITEALQSMAREQHLTLNTLLQGAWALLLSHYSGQQDIVFGTVVSGRPPTLAGSETMVGLFINTLPLRVQIAAQQQLLPWLHLLQDRQADARQFDYTPLVQIQGWSEVPRGQALFESLLIFENFPMDTATAQSNSLDIEDALTIERTNYPLTIAVVPGSRLLLRISYPCNRFEDVAIERLAGHLQTLLESMIARPDQLLCNLPFLTEAEQAQLHAWNSTAREYPLDTCVQEVFESQAAHTPDAVALIYEDEQITYNELNCRANQLAHHLQHLGVGPEMLVGLVMERSVEMLIAILATFKAGGAYLPLDPAYPGQRLEFMLQESHVQVVVTQPDFLRMLPEELNTAVCLGSGWFEKMDNNSEPLPLKVGPHNLAYIIYTSGSTGKPKGAMVTHQGMLNHLYAKIEALGLNEHDTVAQTASQCFDISVWQFLSALLVGGKVQIIADFQAHDPLQLLKQVRIGHITILEIVPSLLRAMLTGEDFSRDEGLTTSALRWLLVTGEAFPVNLWQRWSQIAPHIPVINAYGPTECSDDVTHAVLTESQGTGEGSVTIGRPVANTHIYILDRDLMLVPVGVAGQIYVGGVGVGRGYLDNVERTAEVFIPDPFGKQRGSRLYKTGDRGRYLADGQIEFLGRVDHQVKIRGFRIEPGEITAILCQHPAIQDAVVVQHENASGDKRLVAYIVLRSGQTLTTSQIRQHLQDRLPGYMVPAAFVLLDQLPLTPNGKLDRRALPSPEQSRSSVDQAYTAPRTSVEQLLVTIWDSVLKLNQIGIHDNFFELGGDSILSIQIVARATAAGLPLTPRLLFQHPTISQLAAIVDTVPALQTEQGPVTGSLPLAPIQRWFFSLNLSNPHHWNQVMLLRVPPTCEPGLVRQTIHHLLLQHDLLRLRVQRETTDWSSFISAPEDDVPFIHVALSHLPASEQPFALAAAASQLQASLDLTDGPILRVAFFTLGAQQHGRLLFIIHHLAVDIVSWSILLEDFQSVYEQLRQEHLPVLPPKTTSYQHWSRRLSEYAQSQQINSQLDFWLNQPWEMIQPVPLDIPGNPEVNTEASARTFTVALSSEETQALLTEVPRAYHTHINEVLLTALMQAFARWTGDTALVFHLEGHGREDIFDDVDLSRTVGWFTMLTPLVLTLPDSIQPGDVLKSIKEQLRRVPQHGLSFGLLRYLNHDPAITMQLAALPQPEIAFNYSGRSADDAPANGFFTQAEEAVGAVHNLQDQRPHLLDINSSIQNGQFRIEWTYSTNLHQQATIERLAHSYLEALQELIAHCLSPEAGGYTPSDFPEARLTQTVLDSLLASLAESSPTDKTRRERPAIEAIYPLSPMQEGMLFHHLYDSHSTIYFEQLAITLRGTLDMLAFQNAWEQVIARHPILRTLFLWDHLQTPLQVIYSRVALPWTTLDWQHYSPEEQREHIQDFLLADRVQGFDFIQAPLLRLHLIRLNEQAYHFTWSFHHILLDGWSVATVLGEVFASYEAFQHKQHLSLPAVRPYRDYIGWLQQQDLAQAEAFWRESLRGFTTPTPSGIDLGTTNAGEREAAYHDQVFSLPASTSEAVQKLSREQHLTLNTLMQGAWALLLSHYSGEPDIVFGTIVSGRPPALAGAEAMVGLFINTLPLRVKVEPHQQLLPWLHNLQAEQTNARQFDYTPLVQIQSWSEIPRGQALFESLFVFENFPMDASITQSNSLDVGDAQLIEWTNYPLTIVVVPGPRLLLRISYLSHRFEDNAIERLAGHFQTLLESMKIGRAHV